MEFVNNSCEVLLYVFLGLKCLGGGVIFTL